MKNKRLTLVVAVALVDVDMRILLAQRGPNTSMAGLWEFPGGKVEESETCEEALIRELKEELNITTKKECLAPLTFASHEYPDFHLLMPLYICRKWWGEMKPMEEQNLKWVRIDDMKNYEMPDADRPLIPILRDLL